MVRTLNHYRPESVAMRRVLQENASSAGDASSAVNVIQRNIPGDPPEILIEIALAFVVLVVGWYLSKVAVRIAGRTVARRIERPSVTRTALRGVRAAVLLWAAVVAASILGVGDTQILLSVTVISAVIAVVLAPVVGSLINGLYVLADRPYEIGDMIEVSDAGHRGFVEDITIRYTKIFTLQNTFIVIPNSEIHARDVINYSAEDERTRSRSDSISPTRATSRRRERPPNEPPEASTTSSPAVRTFGSAAPDTPQHPPVTSPSTATTGSLWNCSSG